MSDVDKPQVFLSYAHDDLVTVRKLHASLKERKVKVWFDKVDLGPGRSGCWPSTLLADVEEPTM